MVQDLVGLGPQLARRVGGELEELAAQLLQRAAQRLAEYGGQLVVPGGQVRDPFGLLLQLCRVPLGPVGQLGGVPFGELGDFGGVLFGELGDLGGVAPGQLGELRSVLLGEFLVRPAVGERHHRADQLLPVADGRGRQVDRHRCTALGPQDLPAHPVLAPGLERVGER